MPTYLNERGRGILGALDAVAARLVPNPLKWRWPGCATDPP